MPRKEISGWYQIYRGSNLDENLIITSVKLKGIKKSKELIEKLQKDLINKKNIPASQIKHWKYF